MALLRRLTLRQLEIFNLAANNLNFARTAEQLHLTQPAVSMQIKQLEDALEIPLFERIGRNVTLTEAGQKFKQHAVRLLGEVDDAEQTINALKGLSAGRVSVGLVSTATYFGSRLIAEFSKQWPNIEIQLNVGNRGHLLNLLLENVADLVIMGRIPETIDAEPQIIAPNPHVLVAAANHPLAQKSDVSMAELSQETFLTREPGSGTRTVMEEFFETNEFVPKRIQMLGSNETVKQGVIAGLGISILSTQSIKLECQAGYVKVLHVEGTPIQRHWHVAKLRQKEPSPAMKAFTDFLISEAHELTVDH